MAQTQDPEDRYFEVALRLIKEAGAIAREGFSLPKKDKKIQTKEDSNVNLVTVYDNRVEDTLREGFRKEFPDHRFIGEEEADKLGGKVKYTHDPTWIVDPIDGTTNFIHRLPFCVVSVGLAINKELRMGLIYNPISDELYTARKGQGAYRNGFRIYASDTKDLRDAVVVSTVGSQRGADSIESYKYNFEWFMTHKQCPGDKGCAGHRSFGSACYNMCMIAQGSADAYFEYGLHCWDMAAGVLIVREAGGVCMDPAAPDGELDIMQRRVLCAATPELGEFFKKNLQHVEYESEEATEGQNGSEQMDGVAEKLEKVNI